MLDQSNIKKIVIVGGGTAGWMAAAAFSRLLQHPEISIRLIESEAIGTIGVGEATIPHIQHFNQLLGFPEDDFVKQTNATFKLGIEFVNWGKIGDRYIHPFGDYGVAMSGLRFYNFWYRHQALGDTHSIDDYNLQIMAAKAGKFQRPEAIRNSPLSKIEYAYHFDATLYARFMRNFAEQRGVMRTEGKVTEVTQNPENGFIESVTLENGEVIDGELFIDCSGFRGLLIGQTLNTDFKDWLHYLPCNKAVTVLSERTVDPIPYTRSTAKSAGWQWRIPLQSRTGNGYVYSGEHMSDDEAAAILMDGLDSPAMADPRLIHFKAGVREKTWNKNVVALGLAGGFVEPLESTAIHLVQSAIARLLTNFPDRTFNQKDIDYFNQRTHLEFEQIRDFIILHYKATMRDDSDFWNYCRTMDIPETLRERIEIFEENARLYRHDNELFAEPSWFAVMHGQGLKPRHWHPNANLMPEAELNQRMADIRRVWNASLDSMPTHQQFIDRHCKADL